MKNENVTKLIISQNWWYFQFRRQVWLKLNILPRESFYEYALWAQNITLRSYLIWFDPRRFDPRKFAPWEWHPTKFLIKMYPLQTKPYQHFFQVSFFANSPKTILATHSPMHLKTSRNLAGSAKISAILKISKINIELTFLTGINMGWIHLC